MISRRRPPAPLLAALTIGVCTLPACATSTTAPQTSNAPTTVADTAEKGTAGDAPTTTAASSSSTNSITLQLLADRNHDGKIDAADANADKPAIVLPNIDDDGERCQGFTASDPHADGYDPDKAFTRADGTTMSLAAMKTCNDANDDESNGPDDIADLTLVDVPATSTADTATVAATVTGGPDGQFNVLAKRGDKYVSVTTQPLTPADLTAGITLAVEATDIIKPGDTSWTGNATLTLTVADDGDTREATLPLQVAPFVVTPETAQVNTVLVSPSTVSEALMTPGRPEGAGEGDTREGGAPDRAMPEDLAAEVAAAKETSKTYVAELTAAAGSTKVREIAANLNDIWTQDLFESGYVAKPGPNGPHVMTVLLRSGNTIDGDNTRRLRDASVTVYAELRRPNVGAAEPGVDDRPFDKVGVADTYSATGNFTAVPPYEGHPQGRVLYGSEPNPAMLKLLEAQGMQAPLSVDVSYLKVGHLDEIITFLPSKNARGWVMAVADPTAGIELLKQAVAANPNATMLEGTTNESDARKVADVLADSDVTAATALATTKISEAIATLTKELQLSPDEIVRIPVVFTEAAEPSDGELPPGFSAERREELLKQARAQGAGDMLDRLGSDDNSSEGDGELDASRETGIRAALPDAVNGQLLGNGVWAVPKQFGPVVEGVDIFQAAIEKAVAPHGVTVKWVDDYVYAHLGGGEVHCTTNTERSPGADARWWVKQ